MASKTQLLTEIRNALGPALLPNLTSSSAGSDLFEAYLWTVVVDAARRQNALVTYVNSVPTPGVVFTFPTSPRSIFSPNPYSHAVLDFANCAPLEAHVDIYVSGRSRVPHECDVAVLDRREADLCRQQRVHPRRTKVLIALEAKFYSGTLDLGEARAFLGLMEEIHHPGRFLVSNANSRNVRRMLAIHRCGWKTGCVPAAIAVVENLRGQLETVFENYRAKA